MCIYIFDEYFKAKAALAQTKVQLTEPFGHQTFMYCIFKYVYLYMYRYIYIYEDIISLCLSCRHTRHTSYVARHNVFVLDNAVVRSQPFAGLLVFQVLKFY